MITPEQLREWSECLFEGDDAVGQLELALKIAPLLIEAVREMAKEIFRCHNTINLAIAAADYGSKVKGPCDCGWCQLARGDNSEES